jgi:hypothetical protein
VVNTSGMLLCALNVIIEASSIKEIAVGVARIRRTSEGKREKSEISVGQKFTEAVNDLRKAVELKKPTVFSKRLYVESIPATPQK